MVADRPHRWPDTLGAGLINGLEQQRRVHRERHGGPRRAHPLQLGDPAAAYGRRGPRGGFPVDFAVQVSADNTTWTTVATKTGQARPRISGETLSFTPVTARYVRIGTTKLSADPVGDLRLQLAELEVR
ncbi:discoidin domain-containing protein [Nonomuraea thailandensis]